MRSASQPVKLRELDPDCLEKLNMKTRVNSYLVSTVKLPCDHAWDSGPALWYETMILSDTDVWGDYQRRYTFLEDAERGHADVVRQLACGLNPADLDE